jgi:hypothetical protein
MGLYELVGVYVIAGLGRASYESANRSVFVDMFQARAKAAMPVIMVFTGAVNRVHY